MSAPSEPLSPRAARILYNVDDALRLEGEPIVDVAPYVSRALRHQGLGAARRAWLLLHAVEWQPIATLSSRRGFSWLPRERRRALLAGWERSRLPARRRAYAWLAGLLAEARADAGCGPARDVASAAAGSDAPPARAPGAARGT